jgi:hypothetical protein
MYPVTDKSVKKSRERYTLLPFKTFTGYVVIGDAHAALLRKWSSIF